MLQKTAFKKPFFMEKSCFLQLRSCKKNPAFYRNIYIFVKILLSYVKKLFFYAGIFLKYIFLKFRKFEPRYSYKIYFYRKNKCINYRISRRTGGNYLTTTKQTRFLVIFVTMFSYFRKNPVIAIMDVLSSSFFSRRFQANLD